MQFRFLYLGPTGTQNEVGSIEDLRALVENGTVGELTPLFDALTQQWAPASGHAVYRLLCDDARGGLPGPPAGAEPSEKGASGAFPDLGLTVEVATPLGADTEQAVRDLLKERERGGEEERPPRSDPWGDPTQWGAAAMPPAPPLAEGTPVPVTAPPARPAGSDRPAPSDAAARPTLPAASAPLDGARGHALRAAATVERPAKHRVAPAVLVTSGVVGLLIVLVTVVLGGGRVEGVRPATASLAPPDVSTLMDRFTVAEQAGFRHMVAGMDSLRSAYDVAEVPPVWLEGRYLADATRYPEVEDYWLRYRAFLNAVQASDTALYRAGFMAGLRDEGVEGPVLSLRLSRAMTEFEETQAARSLTYLHMHELAAASLALHDLLVERAPDISYEPALDSRLSRAPVVEALAQDTLLRDRMWVLLDRIFASLEQLGGDLGANRDNLTEMLLQRVEASRAP